MAVPHRGSMRCLFDVSVVEFHRICAGGVGDMRLVTFPVVYLSEWRQVKAILRVHIEHVELTKSFLQAVLRCNKVRNTHISDCSSLFTLSQTKYIQFLSSFRALILCLVR